MILLLDLGTFKLDQSLHARQVINGSAVRPVAHTVITAEWYMYGTMSVVPLIKSQIVISKFCRGCIIYLLPVPTVLLRDVWFYLRLPEGSIPHCM